MKNGLVFERENFRISAASAFAAVIFAVIIYLFTSNVIWLNDELKYQHIYTPDGISDAKIESFGDIIRSQIAHYQTWNGRFLAHVIVQFFCGIAGETWFAVFNALVWLIFIHITLRLIGIKNVKAGTILPVMALLVLALPTKMTPACQIGYVWMYALTGWFIYLFFDGQRRNSLPMLAVLFVFSVLAGNGQESINIPVGGALGIYFLFNFRTFTPRKWVMLIGFAIGSLALCLAPGNFHRVDGNTVSMIGSIYYFIIFDYMLWCLIAVTVLNMIFNKRRFWDIYGDSAFFWNALAIGVIFNIMIGVALTRQIYGIQYLSLLLMIRQLPGQKIKGWITAVLSALVLSFIVYQAYIIYDQKKQWEFLEAGLRENKDGTVYAYTHFDPTPLASYAYSGPIQDWLYDETSDETHFLQLKFKELVPESDFIRILPPQLETGEKIEDSITEYYPNHYLIIKAKNSTARPMLRREFDLPFLHIGFDTLDVTVLPPSIRTDGYDVWLIHGSCLMLGMRVADAYIES